MKLLKVMVLFLSPKRHIPKFQINYAYSFTGYVKQGLKNFLLVPIAFVNEHIETLHEMDIEYCHDLRKKVCIRP